MRQMSRKMSRTGQDTFGARSVVIPYNWKAALRQTVSPANCWIIAIYATYCRPKAINCIVPSKGMGTILWSGLACWPKG